MKPNFGECISLRILHMGVPGREMSRRAPSPFEVILGIKNETLTKPSKVNTLTEYGGPTIEARLPGEKQSVRQQQRW